MVLTIIFDKDVEHVLMCFHNKQSMYNYVGGHVKHGEERIDAAYRELFEETGISRDDVQLTLVRHESVTCNAKCYKNPCWNMTILAGVLNKDVELKAEKNQLFCIDLSDTDTILFETFGNGNCYTYLREAFDILNLK